MDRRVTSAARLGRWREARTADGEVSKQLKGAVKLLAELLGKVHDDLSVLLLYAETAVDDARHVRLALVDVIGVRVVDGVRALPRKVRHEESRMEHVAHGVLQEAIIGESAMTALVGEYPESHAHGSRHHRVEHPQRKRSEFQRNERAAGSSADCSGHQRLHEVP